MPTPRDPANRDIADHGLGHGRTRSVIDEIIDAAFLPARPGSTSVVP
jgi:hypothetical protein